MIDLRWYPPDHLEYIDRVCGVGFRLVFRKETTQEEIKAHIEEETKKLIDIINKIPAQKPLLYKRSFL